MVTEDFNHILDIWIKDLEQYDFIQLCAKSFPNSWSVGQVYMHVLEETNYYIEQIKICIANNNNEFEEMSPFAKKIFFSNEFPDEIIEGPPSNSLVPQPDNMEYLISRLLKLKNEIKNVEKLISGSPYKGKTKHPGLNYFNAREWFQFAEIHFRHHLRQKKRIDNYLKINR